MRFILWSITFVFLSINFPVVSESHLNRPRITSQAVSLADSLENALGTYLSRYAVGDGHTAKAKRYDLGYLREFLVARKVQSLAEITPLTVQDFIDTREALGESPATVRRRYDHVKHFFSFVEKKDASFLNPAKEVRSPNKPFSQPKGLNTLELNALRQASISPFERLVLELGARGGLRRETITLLTFGQLKERENQNLWIERVRIKGRRFVDIPCPPTLEAAIREYLPVRVESLPVELASNPEYPLLVSARNHREGVPSSWRYSTEAVYHAVKRIGARAGIKAFPHKLRHTFAHDLLAATGNNLSAVASAMGHASIQTTLQYTIPSDEEKHITARRMA